MVENETNTTTSTSSGSQADSPKDEEDIEAINIFLAKFLKRAGKNITLEHLLILALIIILCISVAYNFRVVNDCNIYWIAEMDKLRLSICP